MNEIELVLTLDNKYAPISIQMAPCTCQQFHVLRLLLAQVKLIII
jgi:hypothetical protein